MSHRSHRILSMVLEPEASNSSETVKQHDADEHVIELQHQDITEDELFLEKYIPQDLSGLTENILADINLTEYPKENDTFSSATESKINLVADYESDNTIITRRSSSTSDSDSSPFSNIIEQQAQDPIVSEPISGSGECAKKIDRHDSEISIIETQAHAFTSREPLYRARNDPIIISPRYTDESDVDDDVIDPTYDVEDQHGVFGNRRNNYLLPSNSNISSSDSDSLDHDSQRGRKRVRKPENWKQNRAKRLRNEGQKYKSMSKTQKRISARCLKVPCSNCRLKCSELINDDNRYDIFINFWQLGDLHKQRSFITSCMLDIQPKYKYTNAENPRRPNKAFYFTVNNERVRVCKTFFKSTLDITDRMIFTIRSNTNENGFVLEERRGKHGNNKTLSAELVADIKKHINSIPRMESHYTRSQTGKEYIDGSKTIKDLYTDFANTQIKENKETGNYITYYKIFNGEFNLSFHRPKKDQCDLCVSYQNSDDNQKLLIEDKYRTHLKEKELSRTEKLNDRGNADVNNKVVVYDLEAVLPCPRGETSAFYYKSKLNSYNLTLTELNNKICKSAYDNVHCYFWTEFNAKRGAIEIGSCVWDYLKIIGTVDYGEEEKNIIFYSDNCCGQNKNKFIATLYLYAVQTLNISSITHKFLIRGHTQNEADSVHSLIEKEIKKNLKGGPIYTPDQYITLIKSAKKSKPAINVHEFTYDSFVNIKELQEDWGYNFSVDINGKPVNWNEIKQLKMIKGNPFSFYYKNSYEDQSFIEVDVRNKRKKMKLESEIQLKPAYTENQTLSDNKKKDLKELLTKGLIPAYYANFYNTIL